MTQTTLTYQPTLMQKLLGRWYKWWYAFVYTLKSNFNYLWDEFFSLLYQFLGLLAIIIVFLNSGSLLESSILSYLLIGNFIYAFTNANVIYISGNSIKEGTLTRLLLLPQSHFSQLVPVSLANCVAFIIPQLLIFIPLIVYFALAYGLYFNFYTFLALIMTIPIIWFLRFCIEITAGYMAFWTTEVYGFASLVLSLITFLSGSLFPLSYLGFAFKFLQVLPTAWVFHHPMQIYLGKYDFNQTVLVFLGGIAWCVVLYFLAKLVFKLGLKKNESVGL